MTFEEKMCEYESLKQQLKVEDEIRKLVYCFMLGLVLLIYIILR